MSRLFTQSVQEATGPAVPLFAAIKGAMGKVPNAYLTLGSNSPVALEGALNLDGALRKGSLSAREIEVVKLAVSQDADCGYCLAAHTLMGGKAGLSADAILAARHGKASGDARLDALASFAHTVNSTSGDVPDAVLAAVRGAGYSDAHIADALLAVAAITFTNLLNRVNATTLDFPPAP